MCHIVLTGISASDYLHHVFINSTEAALCLYLFPWGEKSSWMIHNRSVTLPFPKKKNLDESSARWAGYFKRGPVHTDICGDGGVWNPHPIPTVADTNITIRRDCSNYTTAFPLYFLQKALLYQGGTGGMNHSTSLDTLMCSFINTQ